MFHWAIFYSKYTRIFTWRLLFYKAHFYNTVADSSERLKLLHTERLFLVHISWWISLQPSLNAICSILVLYTYPLVSGTFFKQKVTYLFLWQFCYLGAYNVIENWKLQRIPQKHLIWKYNQNFYVLVFTSLYCGASLMEKSEYWLVPKTFALVLRISILSRMQHL